ncbi:E3 ubiquitin-protein ligase RMA1H1 isoform X3 [Sorghum bicolor]|uniref:E3 ubiquitin-protein ligase RMA1H1 isoform X2 n=1 Tax=Sorghum bicolor TaxID=4558 RepID=UPI000B4263A5|nr:E3 ubiquitin-protein ligase RMA1H1 isoform X2 [Sorghum bicolor]XP_021314840.1 E3 ubiquitin-protein ligase RMA1H1 isoform X3 [Sorghum bicolor]|eukprot:XP_021314839.1 E3 ubiquitin-protein ligase RMA1H1 isoform X2 [Sorghum bicolor]
MDQTRTGGAGEQPRGAPGEEPAKRVIGADAPAAAAGESGFDCFDCNICLECATEPVVTLCGHLYCWPCIYEWLRPDAEADAMSSARRQCPVCKAAVSPDALGPLYGRGGSSSSAKKPPPRGLASIPCRPALRQSAQDGGGHHHHRHAETDAHAHAAQFDALLPTPFGGRGMMRSTAGGMLGGMAVAVLPMVLRGQAQPPAMHYSGTYHLMSPRQRRWHMEVERSLHQIWFFLFVFVALCLLLF